MKVDKHFLPAELIVVNKNRICYKMTAQVCYEFV